MTRAISLAVVGATGQVGEALLEMLAGSDIEFSSIHAVASEQSAGKRIEFGDRLLKVQNLEGFDFSDVEVALFAVPPAVSAQHARAVSEQGCLVLDLSGVWLADPSVPMWSTASPYLDDDLLRESCLLSVLTGAPAVAAEVMTALSDFAPRSAACTTLLPASAGGRAALEDLARQAARLLNSQDPEPQVFPEQSAFMVLTTGVAGLGSSALAPDQTFAVAMQRVPALASVSVASQSAWQPTFFGCSMSLTLQCDEAISLELAAQLLESAGLPTEGAEAARKVTSLGNKLPESRPRIGALSVAGHSGDQLSCWIGFDNVRYGAAHKGVQILQLLLKDYL